MSKLILPWYFTDREMADYAAKYFAPHGIPPGTVLERAPAPEPTSEADAANHFPGIS
jgi:hypothetical protein